MYHCSIVFLVTLLVTIDNGSSKIPDYIKRCKKNAELPACLKENVESVKKYLLENDGDKLLNLPNLNRVSFPRVEFALTPELPSILVNATYWGVESLEISEITLNANVLQIKAHIVHIEVSGHYSLHGRLLMLPIEGEGEMLMKIQDVDSVYTAKLQTKQRNGKNFYYADENPEHMSNEFTRAGRISIHMDNLFGGDPKLGPEMNALINENWEAVYADTRPSLQFATGKLLFNSFINGYLENIPIDELFE